MSLDYETVFGIGVSIKVSDLAEVLGVTVEGYEERQEPRFDPKTGEPIEPETVVVSRGTSTFTLGGRKFTEDDLDDEEYQCRFDGLMISALLKSMEIEASWDLEQSNCSGDTELAVFFRKHTYDPQYSTGAFHVEITDDSISKASEFSKRLNELNIPHKCGVISLNSIW